MMKSFTIASFVCMAASVQARPHPSASDETTLLSRGQRTPGTQRNLVINGENINAADPTGNIPVIIDLVDGEAEFFCTGSVVNNEWLLTAAHCVVDGFFDYALLPGDAVAVSFATEVGTGTNKILTTTTVAEVFVHPEYDDDLPSVLKLFGLNLYLLYGREAAHDMAMIRLASPLPSTCAEGFDCTDTSVPMNSVMAAFQDESSKSMAKQQEIVASGFGSPVQRTLSTMMESMKPGGGYRGSFWRMAWNDAVGGLSNNKSARQCSGDSGSGAMVQVVDDATSNAGYAIVGVFSGGFPCAWPVGFNWSFRFTAEVVSLIQSTVTSTGGSCEAVNLAAGRWQGIVCSNV